MADGYPYPDGEPAQPGTAVPHASTVAAALGSHDVLRSAGGARRRDLGSNLLAFCRVLRKAIPNVTAGRVIDTYRSLACIDISQEPDFRSVLQANLVSSQEDLPIFDMLYDAFWRPLASSDEIPWASENGSGAPGRPLALPFSEELAAQLGEMLEPAGQEMEEGPGQPGEETDVMAYSRA